MPGTLYVVGTPIGNLEDLSPRAIRVLGLVSLVAAEDTRHTRKLLSHFGIGTPLRSLHAHSGPEVIEELTALLVRGQDIALVSDAGMPGVSDPGARLVASARAAGQPVDVVPGPSALTTAMALSGFSPETTLFLGFAPQRAIQRRRLFQRVATFGCGVVLFESPLRIEDCLGDILACLGDRRALVARELTKIHQSVESGLVSEIINSGIKPIGEFTVVIDGVTSDLKGLKTVFDDLDVFKEFCHLTENEGMSRRDAVSVLAEQYDVSSKRVYSAIESQKKAAG